MLKPLVHFMLIGGALFLLERAVVPLAWDEPRGRVVVGADRVEALRRTWTADTGREPTERELAALVGRAIDEDVLFHTAHRLGFHAVDPVVWRRLIDNMRFISDGTQRTDAELYAEALALGMDEGDLVVRRRLVERMTQALRRLGRGAEPRDDELRDFIARYPDEFREPVHVRFSHVFLSRQRRGDAAAHDAEMLRDVLLARVDDAAGATNLGDPPLVPAHFPLSSEREIAKALGTEFAAAVMTITRGRWAGPVRSAFGFHLVLVHEVRAAATLPLAAVRDRARYGVLREREERAFVAGMRELRERYDVRVGGTGAEGHAEDHSS